MGVKLKVLQGENVQISKLENRRATGRNEFVNAG
jgi:hypothetical protein